MPAVQWFIRSTVRYGSAHIRNDKTGLRRGIPSLRGLAGVTYFLGYTNMMIPKSLPGMGYDSISVALLGNSSPIGAIFAAIVVSIFQQGANYMSSSVGVAKEIASLITGILLLFASCGNYMKYRAARKMQQAADFASQRNPGPAAPKQEEEAEKQ